MSKTKNPLKGLPEDEIIFLRLLAKIYVESIVKKIEEQTSLLPISKSKRIS